MRLRTLSWQHSQVQRAVLMVGLASLLALALLAYIGASSAHAQYCAPNSTDPQCQNTNPVNNPPSGSTSGSGSTSNPSRLPSTGQGPAEPANSNDLTGLLFAGGLIVLAGAATSVLVYRRTRRLA